MTVKIAGNILTLLVNTGESESISVAVWGTILSQLGLYPLLTATISFFRKWSLPRPEIFSDRRIHNWEGSDIHLRRWLYPLRFVNTLLIIPVVLAIISGVWTAPDSTHIDTAYKLREASSILFILFVLVLIFFAFTMPSESSQRRDKVLLQIYIVLPIIFVRVIYAAVQSFLTTPTNPGRNIWVYLDLLLIPDFVSVSIYTLFGFLVERSPVREQIRFEEEQGKAEEYPMVSQQGQGSTGFQMGQSEGSLMTDGGGRQEAFQDIGNGRRGRVGRRQRRRRGPLHMLYYALFERGE